MIYFPEIKSLCPFHWYTI